MSAVGAQSTPSSRLSPDGVGEVRGTLVDSATRRPIASGSITVRRDAAFVGGALPKGDGSFRVDGLVPGTYTIRVRALGFAPLVRDGITITTSNPVVDLGPLMLHTAATRLEGDRVVAEREETVLQPDRTVYSTKNMTAASGGTTIDVLRNIPQVDVDGANIVSLRGSQNVVIQINGRATPLKAEQLGTFLAQMPANVVKIVEVATSPSAKDDPEGTAGIINIILAQDAELGLSGGVLAGTSSAGLMNLSGNIGKQQGPITGYLSVSVYGDRRPAWGTISRQNLAVSIPAFVETTLSGRQRPLSLGSNFRGEYRLNDRDALTFDGYLFNGHVEASNAFAYTDLNASREVIGAFTQANSIDSRNTTLDLDVAFRRQGKPADPRLAVEIEYASNRTASDADLSGSVSMADAGAPPAIPTEHDHTAGHTPYLIGKVDYTHPFSPTSKLEAGAKYVGRGTESDFTALYQNAPTGVFELSPSRTTAFSYREFIGSGYALVSEARGRLQAQAGVRLEEARTRFDLPLIAQRVDKHYASAYPSAVLSYAVSDTRTMRVSYSRRVSRPSPYQLNPTEYRQDTRNVTRGNPNLGAEYIDAVDLGFQDARAWGSLQINPFVKHASHGIRELQFVDTSGISVSSFGNLASGFQLGTDVSVSYRNGPLTSSVGGSVSYYSSDASNLTGSIALTNPSTTTVWWNARGNGTWKFSTLVDAQLFANYRAPRKTESGTALAQVTLSAGVRYKIWGDQGNVALRINDPFGMQKFGYRTANGTIVEYAERFYGARAVYFTITRNFGQSVRLRPKSESEEIVTAPPTP
jgi:hypothetical protein